MMQEHDSLGRPLPRLSQDHVHIYDSNLHLSLSPNDTDIANATRNAFGSSSSSALVDPPLSPGPPLRGYAAAPLGTDRKIADARERDEQYQQMMQSILDRAREQNQAQEQDEDRRIERLLKHIASEEEYVSEVRRRRAPRWPPATAARALHLAGHFCSPQGVATEGDAAPAARWPTCMTAPRLRACPQVDRSIMMHERARHRRRQELYKEWKHKVYDTIQSQISSQLAQLRTQDITARRSQLMEDYSACTAAAQRARIDTTPATCPVTRPAP